MAVEVVKTTAGAKKAAEAAKAAEDGKKTAEAEKAAAEREAADARRDCLERAEGRGEQPALRELEDVELVSHVDPIDLVHLRQPPASC